MLEEEYQERRVLPRHLRPAPPAEAPFEYTLRDAVAVMRTVEAHVLGSALDIEAPGDLLDQASVPAELAMVHAALDPRFATTTNASAACWPGCAPTLTPSAIWRPRP